MADEKKPEKKEESAAPSKSAPLRDLAMLLVGMVLLSSLLGGLNRLLGGNSTGNAGGSSGAALSWNSLTPRGVYLAGTRPIGSLLNPVGTHFITSADSIKIYDTPGGKVVATKKLGDQGVIIGGPVDNEASGIRYWHVRYSDGTIGWVPEFNNAVTGLPKNIVHIDDRAIVGSHIISLFDGTQVYDTPGGNVVAEEHGLEKGVIVGGPMGNAGVVYWQVRFDDGVTGWVAEKNIAVTDDVLPSPFGRAVLFFWKLFSFLKYFIWLVCIGLIVWIGYIIKKLTTLRQLNRKLMYPQSEAVAKAVNPKWERIINHIESVNENDWRLSILEADIMLGDLLDKLSLPGETIGEKLKAVEKSDFTTLDMAWEAHKVRNQIAHEGSDFSLNSRQARQVIEMYRAVFEEFEII